MNVEKATDQMRTNSSYIRFFQPSGQNLKACQLVSFGFGKPDGSGEKRLEELFDGHLPSEGRKNRFNFPAARGK